MKNKKTSNQDLPSSRYYAIVFIEGDSTNNFFKSLSEILDNSDDYEWKYAIQEDFDRILDLKIGDKIVMNFNRDNADSTGVIKRIK